jgi:signal transduction histidine kinase
VAVAARAFERMQQRIASHLAERNEVLGAISHDLQTPITRMRLRAELLDDATLRDKLQSDLGQMQHLVAQGLALARAGHAQHEARVRTDLLALLHSLVGDAQDAGQAVRWLIEPERGCTVVTRPQALRRVLGNLLDNACKFGGEAELMLVHPSQPGQPGRASADAQATLPSVQVRVLDRGPGIAPSELERVLKPFYRSEASRNPATGGAGLGLAIVQRLLPACGATLHLAPREGGGLVATVSLPLA